MTETPLQEYVRTNGLAAVAALGISTYEHPTLPLVGFKYDQLESPKTNEVVRWSRGTVLEKDTWNLVAQPFRRFFNFGENAQGEKFDWTSCTSTTKEDGSLIILYAYAGDWHVNTSGSFALAPYEKDGTETWTELFWKTFVACGGIKDSLDPQLTYIFEICSPPTQVVRLYKNPVVFLLGAFEGFNEKDIKVVEFEAKEIGIKTPESHAFTSIEQVKEFLANMAAKDVSFEGVVIRDKNNVRFKIKSLSYIAMSHLDGFNGQFKTRYLTEIALANETDEFLTYRPEFTAELQEIRLGIKKDFEDLTALWESVKEIKEQKDFALAISSNKYKGILFSARKTGTPLKQLWNSASALILSVRTKQ